jgi:hypothetical protein
MMLGSYPATSAPTSGIAGLNLAGPNTISGIGGFGEKNGSGLVAPDGSVAGPTNNPDGQNISGVGAFGGLDGRGISAINGDPANMGALAAPADFLGNVATLTGLIGPDAELEQTGTQVSSPQIATSGAPAAPAATSAPVSDVPAVTAPAVTSAPVSTAQGPSIADLEKMGLIGPQSLPSSSTPTSGFAPDASSTDVSTAPPTDTPSTPVSTPTPAPAPAPTPAPIPVASTLWPNSITSLGPDFSGTPTAAYLQLLRQFNLNKLGV